MIARLTYVLALALALGSLVACGGPQPAPYVEPDVEGVCKVDATIAATRAPRPTEQADCFNETAFAGVRDTCDDQRDPVACYEAAMCLNLAASNTERDDPMRPSYVAEAMTRFDVACAAGIAEGCVLVAAMAQDEVSANPAHPERAALLVQMCDGFRKACHLGEEFDGCMRCMSGGCTELPGATPAPVR